MEPLVLSEDWNRLALDLRDIARRAFGATYAAAVSLRIFASCRVSRVFFAAEDYADAELPLYLRVLNC